MYAICILTGIIFAVWILTVRWKKNGGTFDQVLDTTLVAVPCGLVGARLYHCITTPDIYFPPTATSSTSSRCGKAAWHLRRHRGGGLGRVPVVPPPALSVRPAGRLHRAGADGSAGHRTTGQLVQPGTVRHATTLHGASSSTMRTPSAKVRSATTDRHARPARCSTPRSCTR